MTTRKPDSMFGSKSTITRSDIERASVQEHDQRGKPEAAGQVETNIDGPLSTPGFAPKLGDLLRHRIAAKV
jgi:hypothetical protein